MTKHLHNLLTATGILMLCLFAAIPARAWTAQSLYEYCGGNAMGLRGSYANQSSAFTESNHLTVDVKETTSGQPILRVRNFMNYFDVYLLISGDKASVIWTGDQVYYPTTSGGYITITGANGSSIRANSMRVRRVVRFNPNTKYLDARYGQGWNYIPSSQLNSYYGAGLPTDITGEIKQDGDGNLIIWFGPYEDCENSASFKIEYCQNGSIVSTNAYDILDNYIITLYKPNAEASCVKHSTSSGSATQTSMTIPVKVTTLENDPDGYDFSMVNFANMPTGYSNFNLKTYSPESKFSNVVKGKIIGDKVEIPQQMIFSSVSGQMSYYNGPSVMSCTNYYTCGFNPDTQQPNTNGVITGKVNSCVPYHVGENRWAKTVVDGVNETLWDTHITLDPFNYADLDITTNPRWAARYENYNFNVLQEKTFDCNLAIEMKHDPNKDFIVVNNQQIGFFNIDYNISSLKNTDYIDHLEMMVVESKHNSCKTVPLSSAKILHDNISLDNLSGTVERFFPTIVNGTVSSDYTFFVKAVYKPIVSAVPGVRTATTLEDTYHSLNSQSYVITGVNGVEADGNLTLQKTQNGVIVHAPSDMAVEVYNMAGVKVAQGVANSEITFDGKGVFVVKAGAKVFKVVK